MAFPNDVDYQLEDCGVACTAVTGGTLVSFYGIVDTHQANVELPGGGYGLKVLYTTLSVNSTVAEDLAVNSRLSIGTTAYQLRDKLIADDGALTTLIIARDG